MATKHGVNFLREEKENGVNLAVALADSYCISEAAEATVVIPQDLPLLDATEVFRACQLAENEGRCIVICPSLRYDGTNLLLRKPPSVISTFYDSDSYNMHVKAAIKLGIPVKRFFSKSVMYDIDTPEDALQLTKEEAVAARSLEFIKSKL
jgi:2-phospho-L-lactate/phosphoenolpyruvate guanylyltransferase